MCCPTIYGSRPAPEQPRQVTPQDVEQVHMALERCIGRGMSKMESVQLLARLGVPCKFAMIVWERLEAENPEFFAAYNAQLEATAQMERCHL